MTPIRPKLSALLMKLNCFSVVFEIFRYYQVSLSESHLPPNLLLLLLVDVEVTGSLV